VLLGLKQGARPQGFNIRSVKEEASQEVVDKIQRSTWRWFIGRATTGFIRAAGQEYVIADQLYGHRYLGQTRVNSSWNGIMLLLEPASEHFWLSLKPDYSVDGFLFLRRIWPYRADGRAGKHCPWAYSPRKRFPDSNPHQMMYCSVNAQFARRCGGYALWWWNAVAYGCCDPLWFFSPAATDEASHGIWAKNLRAQITEATSPSGEIVSQTAKISMKLITWSWSCCSYPASFLLQ